jgi:hypothetical protein
MQPGTIGGDIFEIYKTFKTSKADAERRNRILEIGGLAGQGDYQGAADKALAYGDFESGNNLLNIAQGQKKEAQLDKDRLAGALFAAKDDPAKWASVIQYAKSNGIEIDPEEEDFNTGPTLLMRSMTPEGQLKAQQTDRAYDLDVQRETRLAQEGTRTKRRTQITDIDGKRTLVDMDSGEVIKELGGSPSRSLRANNDQNNAAGFYDRLVDAEKVLSDPDVTSAATDYVGKAKANAPLGIGNYLATPEYQKFDQAQRNFINAVLRKESGAAIAQSEFDNAALQYFPQPGDSEEKIAQKAQNRATVIAAMKRTAASALQQPQQTGANEMPTGEAETAFADARDAIAQGADPQAVMQELIQMGIDPQMAEQGLQ